MCVVYFATRISPENLYLTYLNTRNCSKHLPVMEEDNIKWLPTLYVLDNANRFRMFRAGHAPGVFYSETGLLYKANGDPGKITQTPRKIPVNNRSDTPKAAAKAYAYQKWEAKQRVERYKHSEKRPKIRDTEDWKDDIKWPAVCKAWSDCNEDDRVCDAKHPWYGQGKANGDRLMAWKCGLSVKGVKLMSRKCAEKTFMVPIRKDCCSVFKYLDKTYPDMGDVGLDGEVFVPDEQHHQTSRSIVSRSVNKHDDEDRLVFFIFDIMEYTLSFRKREKILQAMAEHFSGDNALDHIRFMETRVLKSDDEVTEFMAHCAVNGFEEGIVLRRPHLLYSDKKEHKHKEMVKLKKSEDAEFIVIGFKEGNSDREGCVVWHLRDQKHKRVKFWCMQTGTVEYQRELYKVADSYMGKLLTVNYATLSEDGVPIMPHALRFRDDDDLASAESSSE